MSSFKTSIIFGAIWSIVGQFGYVGVVLITNIILSRLLSPYVFGQIGIVMFFIILFNVLVEGGMGGALIRKKEVSNIDYTTVFIFNLLLSLFLFILLIITSGSIASYYKDPDLRNILIISGLLLIFNSFQLVHNIKLIRELRFKRKAAYSLCSIILASLVGLIMAYTGFGVWSMVIIQLSNAIFLSLFLWFIEGNFGKLIFSKSSFKELIGFGANTTFALMVNTAFENIYQLVLGRFFSINQVGFFYQAKKLLDMPAAVVSVTGSGVVYSSLSKLQSDLGAFLKVFRKVLFIYTVIVGLVVTLVFFYAENIILILYGSKWIESSYYMKLLCIVTFFTCVNYINELIFKVFNQTKRILQVMIIRNAIQAITILLGVYFLNLDVLIYGFILAIFTSFMLYFYFSREVLQISTHSEIIKIAKIVGLSVCLVISFTFITNMMQIFGMIKLILAPLIILIYLLGIQYLNIFDIKSELRFILKKQ